MVQNLINYAAIFLMMQTAYADYDKPSHKNWFLIGGEVGLTDKSSVISPEVENSGLEFGVKGLWSHYRKNWIWDAGLGWRQDKLEEDNVKVDSKTFFVDLGVRYRILENLSFGPSLVSLLGSDTSFSDIGTNSDDKSLSFLAGGRIMYDLFSEKEKNLIRLGVGANTDLNISSRKVTTIQFIVEFGWPFGGKGVEKAPEAKVEEEEPLNFNLMNAGVSFAVSSARLIKKSKTIINQVAKILIKYQGEWTNISIEGHTDVTGNYKKNIDLSRARANSVKKMMVSYGIDESLIVATGYGPDRPLKLGDTDEAHAINRRVELQITGLNPSAQFVNELKAVIK